jgi:hypothetical protein
MVNRFKMIFWALFMAIFIYKMTTQTTYNYEFIERKGDGLDGASGPQWSQALACASGCVGTSVVAYAHGVVSAYAWSCARDWASVHNSVYTFACGGSFIVGCVFAVGCATAGAFAVAFAGGCVESLIGVRFPRRRGYSRRPLPEKIDKS